ncbi:hypothetical protein GGS20DRAFT_594370 [Poronia punctata]|nr:hypothetical protein GGS20DRAFT_594370 [Poronia punctata]
MSTPRKRDSTKSTLAIGIDFGTTYSGASWLICKHGVPAGEPEVVTHWLSALSRNNDRTKVPSKLYYEKDSGEVKWGYNIPTDVEPIEWFKLLLLDEKDLPKELKNSSHIEKAREMMNAANKTPVDLVSDYLKALWDHVISEIKDAKGTGLVNGTQFHVALSVPAIWNDHARGKMREAAKRAGILDKRIVGDTTLDFISEPEAAALATLPELDNRDDLSPGDCFVVLDAGGGTVDIISYKVDELEPMVISECVEGEGALCGATFVDNAFASFIQNKVGPQSWRRMETTAIRKMMNNEWEHGIKKDFDGSQTKYTIDLPKKNKRGQLNVLGSDITGIFDGTISEICDLLQKQLDGIESRTQVNPKFVILVGGFGRCQFLFKSLQQRFRDKTDILQARSDKPWSAICRGATLSGAMGRGLIKDVVQVKSRVARMSYGWTFSTVFDENIHNARDKRWNDVEHIWEADDQMEWAITRGQDVSTVKPEEYPYYAPFSIKEHGRKEIVQEICTSKAAYPSSRKDDTVDILSSYSFLTPRPVETLPIEKKYVKQARVWNHKLRVRVSGAALDITVVDGDEEVTSHSVSIDTK